VPGDGKLLAVRDTAILSLLLCTGIKVSEMVQMKRADLDLPSRRVLVAGLGNRRRWLPISDEVAAALDRYLHMNDATGRFIPAFADRAFLNVWGSALSARSVRRKMAKYLEIAGLPANIKAYDLRYSFTRDLLNGGTDLNTVKQRLGGLTFSARKAHLYSLAAESTAAQLPPALPVAPMVSAA
jgi:site-specific recombinase XerD